MITLRSILFNIVFYANLIIRMIVLTPIYFLMPRKPAYAIPKAWAKSSTWLMEKIVGTTFEIEGLENIPKVPAGRRAPSRSTNTASPACIATSGFPSSPLPCIPACSGRAAPSANIQAT